MGWKSNRIPQWAATAAALGSLLVVATATAPRPAAAQTVKPRFLILVDTSGSMAQNATGTSTHGDGSREHPGCDLDANTRFDDSKMFQAKAALNDTVAAFRSHGFDEFIASEYLAHCPPGPELSRVHLCRVTKPGSGGRTALRGPLRAAGRQLRELA